ncbi:Pex12 amino terminal region-domain-containing protein [Flammula alnicola]|nr:Pex12 amino terminal region-domain-containing protein [Flammula alnicola]
MSSLLAVLEDAWSTAQPKLTEIRAALNTRNPEHPRIIRVGQLDSELLDQELAQLLQEPINKALSMINSTFRARFEPELNLLIQLTLYKLSIWNTGASYGAKLQDLRYVVSNNFSERLSRAFGIASNTLLLHGALTLVLPYVHNRFRSHALSQAWPDAPSSDYRRKAWDALGSAESIHALLGLTNFVAFLWSGRYRTLADRLLKMSLVPSRRLVKRDVSYEFMNRQMVWHAFTEFLLFLLPLISARTIRRRIYRITSLLSPTFLYSLLPFRNLLGLQPIVKKGLSTTQKRGKFWALPQDQCAICAENAQFSLNVSEPTNLFTSSSATDPPAHPIYNPYQTSCGHIYCYHCVAERIIRTAEEADDELGWECLRCGEEVKEAHRYTVDIIESELSESDYEFSSDLDIGTDLSGSMGSYSESAFSE